MLQTSRIYFSVAGNGLSPPVNQLHTPWTRQAGAWVEIGPLNPTSGSRPAN